MNYERRIQVAKVLDIMNSGKSSPYVYTISKTKKDTKQDYTFCIHQMSQNLSTEKMELSTILYDPTDLLGLAKSMGAGFYISATHNAEAEYPEVIPQINLY